MRHRKKKFKLGKPQDQRKALIRSLLISLIKEEKIITSYRRAKEASRWADRLINLTKRNDLSSRREAFKYLQDRDLVKKLFDDIGPRFKDLNGGYTKVIKYKNRKGDNCLLAIFSLTRVKQELLEEKTKRRLLRRKKKEEKEKEEEKEIPAGEEKEKPLTEEKVEERPPKKKKIKEEKKSFLQGLKGIFKKRKHGEE